jgi:precorrin-6Y C5,15-methyltransferase (decarboxylating)
VLRPGGCVVFNSVSDESREAFRQAGVQAGMLMEEEQRIAVDDFNPITVMKLKKYE